MENEQLRKVVTHYFRKQTAAARACAILDSLEASDDWRNPVLAALQLQERDLHAPDTPFREHEMFSRAIPGWAKWSLFQVCVQDEQTADYYDQCDDREKLNKAALRVGGAIDLEALTARDGFYLPQLIRFDPCFTLLPTFGIWLLALRDPDWVQNFTSDSRTPDVEAALSPKIILQDVAAELTRMPRTGNIPKISPLANILSEYELVMEAINEHVADHGDQPIRKGGHGQKPHVQPLVIEQHSATGRRVDPGPAHLRGAEKLAVLYKMKLSARFVWGDLADDHGEEGADMGGQHRELLKKSIDAENPMVQYVRESIAPRAAAAPAQTAKEFLAEMHRVEVETIKSRIAKEKGAREALPTNAPPEEQAGTRRWDVIDAWRKRGGA